MSEVFKGIGKIQYEGPLSRNPLAFRYYDAEQKIAGKTLREHLRYAIAYWHCHMAAKPAFSDPDNVIHQKCCPGRTYIISRKIS